MAVNFHVQGHRRRTLFTHPNASFLNISLKQSGIKQVRSREGVVSESSHPIAPQRNIPIRLPSKQILEDPLRCLNRIWYKLTEELGYSPPYTDVEELVAQVVAIARGLNMDGYDMSMGYDFFADMEICIVEQIDIIRNENNEQYSLLDGEVNTGTSISAIEKLKAGRFIVVNEKKELGSCCICLEEMRGWKVLVGLPCKHVFHDNCVLQWLHKTNSCPLCRTPLAD